MKAVNQSVGRAIRHREDYAAIIFLDHRFTSRGKILSHWLTIVVPERQPVYSTASRRVGRTTLCHSWLYPPSQGLRIWPLSSYNIAHVLASTLYPWREDYGTVIFLDHRFSLCSGSVKCWNGSGSGSCNKWVFLNFFACWWEDPLPDPYSVHIITDSDPDPIGPKTYGSR